MIIHILDFSILHIILLVFTDLIDTNQIFCLFVFKSDLDKTKTKKNGLKKSKLHRLIKGEEAG